MNTIKATMFIVPNRAITVKEQRDWDYSSVKQIENLVEKELKDEEKLIEIWVFDDNEKDENSSGNWACHGRYIPSWDEEMSSIIKNCNPEIKKGLLKIKKENRWPMWLPLSTISSLKEGEKINLKWKSNIIELTANQTGTRYNRYGKFEEVLQRVINA